MSETRCAPAHWAPYLLTGSKTGLSEDEIKVAEGWKAGLAPLVFTADLGPDGEGAFGLGAGRPMYTGPLNRFELDVPAAG